MQVGRQHRYFIRAGTCDVRTRVRSLITQQISACLECILSGKVFIYSTSSTVPREKNNIQSSIKISDHRFTAEKNEKKPCGSNDARFIGSRNVNSKKQQVVVLVQFPRNT